VVDVAHVLVVDDEEDIRDVLDFELSRRGFAVTTAESGEQAIAFALARRFQVAITDLKMPGLDGLETLRALKEIDPALPVVVATGFASQETNVECAERGAFGCLWKPFELHELVTMVRAALAARE
jgi:two-component system response regulator PilR (NtrC family)